METAESGRDLGDERGGREALAELFETHREGLRRWVEVRLDRKMAARVSPSDVMQEVYLAAEQRLEHFRAMPDMPFRVWIQLLAGQRLVEIRRRHVGARARGVGREVAIGRDDSSGTNNGVGAGLADDLTSPSQAAMRKEAMELLVEAIEGMDPMDREVLSLRHFDERSNDEVARLLGIPKGTASKRYVRALDRLRAVLEQVPGLLESPV